MKIASIYIVTAFLVILALLLAQTLASADIPHRYYIPAACFQGWKPTGYVETTKDTFRVECISKQGDLETRVWSRL